ncbi:Hypothetical predicted protein, partial [Pelobates cultripes]
MRPKSGRQPTTGGYRACSGETLTLIQARGTNSLLTTAALSDYLDVFIFTRHAGLCMAKKRGQQLTAPK